MRKTIIILLCIAMGMADCGIVAQNQPARVTLGGNRCDVNIDDLVDSTDLAYVIANLLGANDDSRCDVNLDGSVDATDLNHIIGYLLSEPDLPDYPSYFSSTIVPELDGVPSYHAFHEGILPVQSLVMNLTGSSMVDMIPGGSQLLSSFISESINSKCDAAIDKVKSKLGRDDVMPAYLDVKIHYHSPDPCGNDALMSGRAVIGGFIIDDHFSSLASEIMIAMPYTLTDNASCATESMPLEVLAGPETVVIMPDILGYGVSRDRPTPYIFNESAGRMGYDLALCVVDYMNRNGLDISSDLRTYSCGVSQGGGYGLAVHKQMEGVHPETGAELNFAGSFTAAGPYSPEITFHQFSVERRSEKFGETAAFPMLYLAAKEYYPDLTASLEPTDVMKPELVATGILDIIMEKEKNSQYINQLVVNTVGAQTFDSMANPDFREGGNEAYSVMAEIFHRESTLLGGWSPQSPVKVMFSTKDDYVPYDNYTALKEAFPSKIVTISIAGVSHLMTGLEYYRKIGSNAYRN